MNIVKGEKGDYIKNYRWSGPEVLRNSKNRRGGFDNRQQAALSGGDQYRRGVELESPPKSQNL